MHELGIVIEIVKTVSRFCEEQNIDKVQSLVLQVGEISPVVPRFLEECFPAAVDGTFMEDTKLVIEILPANAYCEGCGKVYRVTENRNKDKTICPMCGSKETNLLNGQEFSIKEIIVPGEDD